MKFKFRSRLGGSITLALFGALLALRSTIAAELKEATVTQIIKEVQLLPTGEAARAAVLRDNVRNGTAVRTGSDSRTELTFTDQTLARLGANTIFSFNEGTRNLDLAGGAMLLHVPKGSGGAKISTAAVTAAITGTTVIIEFQAGTPVSAQNQKRGFAFFKPKPHPTRGGYIKFVTLEGIARIYLNNRLGESVLVPAGQMLILTPDAARLPDPVDVDLERLLKTSMLIVDFPPLPSEQLMAAEVQKQRTKKAEGKLRATNLVIYGHGTAVSLKDPPPLDTIDQSIAALGTASVAGLNEVGPLKTITADPYHLGSGTTIRTAPTITTGGVTDHGKIYRNVAKDGLPSDYFFGSTTSFDKASGFNLSITQPTAAFRFKDLLVFGVPTIKVPKGGARNLAFIAEGTINPEAPGGTLTFPGMNSVLFATEAGSLNFSTPISFSDINDLTFYARGAASTLFVQSDMFNVGALTLLSEGLLTIFNSSETLTTSSGNGGTLTGLSDGDILVESSHIMATSGILPLGGAPAGAGGSVSLTSKNGGITLSGSTIQVSSADPPGTPNRRSSARGGTISIESNRPDNVAIQINSSSQLLSLLEAAAPGPGGLITIKATGLKSTVSIGGTIEATHGGVDIRHAGDLGTIDLDQITVRGDIIKIAVLGTNGVLTIGGGTLSADSILKLYAPSSSGMIRFISDCTIGAKVTNIIAAGTVTIAGGVMVTVTGSPVSVFTNAAHYTGFGGDGSTTGHFAGLGATNPQPLSAAPPLGPPGGN
ncbi:MAG TPA: FecR family protein [Chthoniobacterales bacterium]|jgi:hypothetical protein|nr:FecR family protein [Chthoniobacterales bacterium]